MNFLSLVTIAEALCGPGALDAALKAGDLFAEQVKRDEDRATGADGRKLCAGGRSDAVAMLRPPRAAFCRRRMCRRAP